MLAGLTVFAALLALAVAAMVPAPDYALVRATPDLELSQLNVPPHYVVNAFFPFSGRSRPMRSTLLAAGVPSSQRHDLAAIPPIA